MKYKILKTRKGRYCFSGYDERVYSEKGRHLIIGNTYMIEGNTYCKDCFEEKELKQYDFITS